MGVIEIGVLLSVGILAIAVIGSIIFVIIVALSIGK